MIAVKELKFSYLPTKPLIEQMSFSVETGEVFGFLGPSGAGKSTLQKILCGILRDYQGSVMVNGSEVKRRTPAFYRSIGVDFEFPNFYGKFTAIENLRYFASLYSDQPIDIIPLLERVELSDHAHKKVAQFSKGMKMRLAFVRAILHRPQLLFLDEPTSGLDPAYARLIKQMIREQQQAGTTVIMTTHNMHDAEDLCDRVAFIVDGAIKALDTPENFKRTERDVMVNYTYLVNGQPCSGQTQLVALASDKIFVEAMRAGRLTRVHSEELSLEDVFINVTGRQLL